MTAVANELVDILLETDEEDSEMSRFVRDALFRMNWKRKPYAGAPDDPISGDYRLEFDTSQGYSGSVAFSLHTQYARKLHGNVSIYVVLPDPTYGERSVSSRWRPFTIKQNQLEQFRAAWQKFVREQIPLIIQNGVPSKMRLAAQVSKVLKPFQPTKAQLATDPDIERLKALFDKADIPAEELSHVVDEQDQHENGHTTSYEDMTPEDVRFWTNWVMHWAQQHGKVLERLEDELIHAIAPAWVKAERAWDKCVTAGYGDNPWEAVLRALKQYPDTDPFVKQVARKLDLSLEQVSSEGETAEETWPQVCLYAQLALGRPKSLMPSRNCGIVSLRNER